jgi:hypothetical protein
MRKLYRLAFGFLLIRAQHSIAYINSAVHEKLQRFCTN